MIILVGASASGKTVIGKYLISNFHFKKFVTTTTRDMRLNEKQNIDYHFISKEEFFNRIANNDFIEYTEYNGKLYGSEKKEIATNKILILEPNGLKHYLKLNDKNTIVTFYIKCAKNIRIERMEERKDDEVEIKKRIDNDENIFTDELDSLVDYVVDSSNKNVEEMGNLIYKLYVEKITSSH